MMRVAHDDGDIALDETWGYTHSTYNPSDTNVVCDWSGVTGMERPTCTTGTCPGHREDDTLPFYGLYSDQESLFTNAEFYTYVHPANTDLPYAYDSLTYWKGCGGEGSLIDFDAVLAVGLPT